MSHVYFGRPIRAVVLDFDGTLVHSTVDFSRMKLQLMGELEGKTIPQGFVDQSITVTENVGWIYSHLSSTGRADEWEAVEALISGMMERAEMERVHLTSPVDGSREAVLELRRMGLRVGLLTRGSRRYATAAIGYAGLGGIMDALMFRDDHGEREAKPNPIALRRMARLLDVPVEECLMVGDHSIDSICAAGAGAAFLGVLTGSFSEDDWRQAGCRYVDSVVDVPGALSRADRPLRP